VAGPGRAASQVVALRSRPQLSEAEAAEGVVEKVYGTDGMVRGSSCGCGSGCRWRLLLCTGLASRCCRQPHQPRPAH
jgi:hypothetical protein